MELSLGWGCFCRVIVLAECLLCDPALVPCGSHSHMLHDGLCNCVSGSCWPENMRSYSRVRMTRGVDHLCCSAVCRYPLIQVDIYRVFHRDLEIYADALLLFTSRVASSGIFLRGCYTLEGHRAVYS